MGDVIDITGKIECGDMAFMMCPCSGDPVPFLVQAMPLKDKTIVTGLVCPECENFHPVVDGIVLERD